MVSFSCRVENSQVEQDNEELWRSIMGGEQGSEDQTTSQEVLGTALLTEVKVAEAKLVKGEPLTLPEAAAIWVSDLKRAVSKRRERRQFEGVDL